MTKDQEVERLKKKLEHLIQSPLYAFRKENNYYPVLGDGSLSASIVFVGEAPGKKEAETGKPFMGAAGKMLDSLLLSINLSRNDIYITNLVNDRPPDNRDPKPAEIEIYTPILMSLLAIIQPKVIVTLGRFSMTYLLNTFQSQEKEKTIKELHGTIIPIKVSYGHISLVPLYHPAFALYNGGMRTILQKDFQVLTSFHNTSFL